MRLEDTFAYDVEEVIEYTNRVHPRMLLLASPNNPTGNSLTSEEIGRIMENIPSDTMVLIDEAYARLHEYGHGVYRTTGGKIQQPDYLPHTV